jgi:hypothetical protein
MSQKKALLDQLAFFQTLNMNKSALRRQLRTAGFVEIVMYNGTTLRAESFSQAWKCIRFNWKKTVGMSYRTWKRPPRDCRSGLGQNYCGSQRKGWQVMFFEISVAIGARTMFYFNPFEWRLGKDVTRIFTEWYFGPFTFHRYTGDVE